MRGRSGRLQSRRSVGREEESARVFLEVDTERQGEVTVLVRYSRGEAVACASGNCTFACVTLIFRLASEFLGTAVSRDESKCVCKRGQELYLITRRFVYERQTGSERVREIQKAKRTCIFCRNISNHRESWRSARHSKSKPQRQRDSKARLHVTRLRQVRARTGILGAKTIMSQEATRRYGV